MKKASSKTKILVVDDTPEILTMFSAILRSQGHFVVEAKTGRQAMASVLKHRPDLVLLDVILPDIGGIEVCRFIKEHTDLRNTFVVLISGEAMSVTHKVDGFGTGADDYLTKPVALGEFVARIQTMIRLQQTNAALRASEEHYRRLVEILPDAVALVDVRGRIETLNHRALVMLGYDQVEELKGVRSFRLTRRDQWRGIVNEMRSLQTAEVMSDITCVAIRKGGMELPLEIHATTLIDAGGATRGMLLVARDLTERLWVERLMHVQRDFGVFLSSANGQGAAAERLLDATMQFGGFFAGAVYLENPKTGGLVLETHCGLSAEQLRHISRLPAWTQEQGPHCAGADGLAQAIGEPGACVICAPVSHGKTSIALVALWARQPAQPRVVRAVQAIAGQSGDAIARIRAEESLRAGQQLLIKTVDSIRSAVFVVDTVTDRILEVNQGATAIFGYSQEEMLGARTVLLHVSHNLWRHFRRQARNEMAERGIVTDFELNMKRNDGTVFPAEQSTAFISNDSGRVIRSVMVIRDIRDRKEYEHGLRLLPYRIMEAQEAERKRVARELHDGVNQLIASAKMRLQKLEDRLISINPSAKEMLSRAYGLMVQALEENRRIAQNLRPSDLDELGFAAACRNYCDQVRLRSNLAFTFEFSGLHRRLHPDCELHLFRILQEAVSNIEKHAKANDVHVQLKIQNDTIILTVKDDGQGFNSRHDDSQHEKGTGMGLTNMRERAMLLEGSFDVSSSPSGGSVITVTAPCNYRRDVKPLADNEP